MYKYVIGIMPMPGDRFIGVIKILVGAVQIE